MHPVRGIVLVIGIAVFIFGVYLLFFEAGLDRWISIGILTAGIVIFLGIILMGFAGGAPEDRPRETREREVIREPRGPGGGYAHERRYKR